ncbi:hypothetical protein BN11_4610006 [Nostocoides australiense Ben110]|uniref:Uncharacterized protein n=1 Tax=Nostocoides australiense Ben110 TaxID=1193182 RepID=W6JZI1_9MICO|nr:hypothetical protein BN11_4610006 [Tetrasphaera australiensis Ben110]
MMTTDAPQHFQRLPAGLAHRYALAWLAIYPRRSASTSGVRAGGFPTGSVRGTHRSPRAR